jgi:hypothetical protein
MDIFSQLVEKIIEEQEHIIGPIALEQARKITGLTVDWQKREIKIEGNQTVIVETLVAQYKGLFGQASVEACKEAVRNLIEKVPKNQIPALLR